MHTNIPGSDGTVRIKLQGEVWQPVQVTPRHASFGRLGGEAASKGKLRKLTIINKVEGVAKLAIIKSSNPSFTAEVVETKPGKEFELTVTLVPPLKSGNNRGKIELSTGIPDKPTLSIPVSAVVTLDVDATPDKLTLPGERTGEISRQIYVRNYSKKPIKISGLGASNPTITASIQETKPGKSYRITVNIPADYKVAAGGDHIKFDTDCPAVPHVVIPITERKARRTASRSRSPKPGAAKRPGLSNTGKPNKASISNRIQPTMAAEGMKPTMPAKTIANKKASVKPAPAAEKPADTAGKAIGE